MNSYNYAPSHIYSQGDHIIGLIVLGVLIGGVTLVAAWPSIKKWINKIKYRNHTIKSFVICQKTPDIDLKKLHRVVDDTNNFLRGKEMNGIKKIRKKIKNKNLISITSVPGNDCYYFVIWYKDK